MLQYRELPVQPLCAKLPTGAFVCHRQDTPRTNTTHSSATQFKRIRTLQLSGPWSRSSLGFGSGDRCCAGNILVESSSPQPQDTGAVQLTHLRFGLKSVRILLVKPSRYSILQSTFRVPNFRLLVWCRAANEGAWPQSYLTKQVHAFHRGFLLI